MSTFLLSADNHLQYEPSHTRVREIIDKIDCVLEQFIDKQHASGQGREARNKNLALIISRAARLGMMLFSQPTTWGFSWDMPTDPLKKSSQEDDGKTMREIIEIIVYPAIYKTGDLDGRKLQKAILKDSLQVASYAATASTAILNVEEDAVQSDGESIPERGTVPSEEEAVTDTTSAESLLAPRRSKNTPIAAKKDTVREENSFSNPREVQKTHGQDRPSKHPINNAEPTIAGVPSDEDMLNISSMTEHQVSSKAKVVGPDLRAAGNGSDRQQIDSASLAGREAADPKETIVMKTKRRRKKHRRIQTQEYPASEAQPRPPATTDVKSAKSPNCPLQSKRLLAKHRDWRTRHDNMYRTETPISNDVSHRPKPP